VELQVISFDDAELQRQAGADALAVADPRPNPAEAASLKSLSAAIASTLADFPVKERRIVEKRFGLLDGEAMTLEEVGQRVGVTRERIRQIEAKILKKLRGEARSATLEPYALSVHFNEP
jgi:RNA polymerase sigma factor (sigma-70 family)